MHTEFQFPAFHHVQRQLIPQSVILSRSACAAQFFKLTPGNVSVCFNLWRNGFSLLCHLLHLELQICPEQRHSDWRPEWRRTAFTAAQTTARAATRAAAAAFETR